MNALSLPVVLVLMFVHKFFRAYIFPVSPFLLLVYEAISEKKHEIFTRTKYFFVKRSQPNVVYQSMYQTNVIVCLLRNLDWFFKYCQCLSPKWVMITKSYISYQKKNKKTVYFIAYLWPKCVCKTARFRAA